MTPRSAGAPTRIADEAREWLLRNSLDGASSDAQRAFHAWREADPRHRDAYVLAERAWQDLARLGESSDVRAMMAIPSQRVPVAATLAAAAAVVLCIGLWLYRETLQPRVEHFATQTGQIREFQLPDGSTLVLGAESSLRSKFTDRGRRIELINGEAYFSVAPDVQRPFVVHFEGLAVRVLGTRFDVRTGAGRVRIAVEEGTVEVARADRTGSHESAEPARRLQGGEGIAVTADGRFGPVYAAAASDSGAWRSGHLRYDDAPLADVVADANRYFDGEIRLASADIGELRVTTSFRANQVRQMLGTLSSVLPIEASSEGDGQVLLRHAAHR